MSGTNGVIEEKVADVLKDEISFGYRPVMPLEALWGAGAGDMPQVTLRRDLEFMQMHPIVSSGIEYYKSGIAGAEFWGGPDQLDTSNDKGKPISPDQKVSQFVLAHVERFWQRGVPVQQEAYIYGWAPGEHIYKDNSGMLVWSHLKGFHPNDGFVLTLNHQPIGLRIKSIRDDLIKQVNNERPNKGTIDLWFACNNIPAKAAWYPHRPRFNQFYGRSQLLGAWRPWRRLGWRDAVEQVIDAAIYRAGYKGPVVRHPPEDMQTARTGIPATVADSSGGMRRSAQDVARQLVEWAKAGAGFTLSSAQYPQAQGGGPKWDIEWPDHVMDVKPLIEAAKYLEDQIMLGIGVPPELVKAGGTGSGYSGRSIPREAFLDQQQRIADAMLQGFVEQVVKPLVLMNFGDIPFSVQCKPLLKSQVENKQGQPVPPLPQAAPGQNGQPGGQPPNGQQAPPTPKPPAAAMSLGGDVHDRAKEIVRRVLEKRAALSTDAGGYEHKGKGTGGGQFIPKSGYDRDMGEVVKSVKGYDIYKTPSGVYMVKHKSMPVDLFSKLDDAVKYINLVSTPPQVILNPSSTTLKNKTSSPLEEEAQEATTRAYSAGHDAIQSGDKAQHAEAARLHRVALGKRKNAAKRTKSKVKKNHVRMAEAHSKSADRHDKAIADMTI